MPRKIAGREISTMDEFTVARSMPTGVGWRPEWIGVARPCRWTSATFRSAGDNVSCATQHELPDSATTSVSWITQMPDLGATLPHRQPDRVISWLIVRVGHTRQGQWATGEG